MEKVKGRDSRKYIDRLDSEHRVRYLEKIQHLNGFDPYSCPETSWTEDYNAIPPLDFPGLTSYLVCGISAYTLDQFRSYKSLEAHMQFTDGWVHGLRMFSPPDCDKTVVKAKVLHSQRMNEKLLQPWIIVTESGDVIAAHCDCMAGLGETCTHVGAVLFKIEAVVRMRERTTVTGVAAYWMIPSTIDKVRGKVGYNIDFTTAKTRRQQLDNTIGSGVASQRTRNLSVREKYTTTAPTQERINSFLQALHATGDRAVLLSSTPEYCNNFRDPVKPVLLPKSLTSLRNPACDCMSNEDLMAYCKTVVDKMGVTAEEAAKIERDTRHQHKSASWFSCRAGRVTASKLHTVTTFRQEKPALSTIKSICYPSSKNFKNDAVTWGIENEDKARKTYEEEEKRDHCGFVISKCGLVINPDFGYMGASPDGIISCDCCGKGCLEVKCSYKHREVAVATACNDKGFCLEALQNGECILKKGHAYYAQVQGQILATESEYCDFVMFTNVDIKVVRVEPDLEFQEHLKRKAKEFFLEVVLPELVAKRFTVGVPSVRVLGESNSSRGKKGKAKAKKGEPLWCHCRRPAHVDDLIGCDNSECEVEWFHLGCVGLKEAPDVDEAWFCEECVHK